MIDFISNNWSEILSVIGAAAWLPIVLKVLIDYFRKIHMTVLDSRILTDAFGVSAGKRQRKDGTILMFVANMFIKNTTFFARNIEIVVELKNGTKLKTEILDFSGIESNNSDGTRSVFNVSIDKEFNISRTLYADQDNIKYVAVLVESAKFSSIGEIQSIRIYSSSRKTFKKFFAKKTVINLEDFPTFNSSHLIDSVEKIK